MQAQPGRYSYMAALTEGLRENGSIESYCGGSMVAPDVLLTAAHCVDGWPLASVAIGGYNKRKWKGEVIAMSKVIVHEDFNWWTMQNDFAIVILEKVTTMNVTFPKLNGNDLYPADGTISRVMGWGTTSFGGRQSKKLLEVDIPIISNEDCDECYGGNDTIFDSMICAYQTGGGVDSCLGKCYAVYSWTLLNLLTYSGMTLTYFIQLVKLCRRFR
jgi:trypsin